MIPKDVGGYIIPPIIARTMHTKPAKMKSGFRRNDMILVMLKGLLVLSMSWSFDQSMQFHYFGPYLFKQVY
jgi:hypothetical protein